jgi:hypothetical protein
MKSDQNKEISIVYDRFLESEDRGWDDIDTYMELLEYLENDQLHREADVLYTKHSLGKVRCMEDHAEEKCVVPHILSAVSSILDTFKDTGKLSKKKRYILQYYLALDQAQMFRLEYAK